MKKIYFKPAMKTIRLPELMDNAPIASGELNPEGFEFGAKGFDMEEEQDDNSFVIKQRNVWDD